MTHPRAVKGLASSGAPRPLRCRPHAVFPIRRAVPPVSWPLQRHDWQALIFTICVTAIFWQ